MKHTIYYFSGTGNSLAIARKIAVEMPETAVESISKLMMQKGSHTATGEMIGFIFPVYCHRLPAQVKQFIKQLNIEGDPYCYTIVTHNGSMGGCGEIVAKLLHKKGKTLHYSNHILMPGNSIIADGYTNTPQEQQKRLTESETAVKNIVADLKKGRKWHYPNPDSWLTTAKTATMFFLLKNVLKIEAKFHTTESCNGCGSCIKVCPSNNISLDNKTVIWGKTCEQCLACIHWCPRRAIEIDKGTGNRIRYHHPEITIGGIGYR